MDIQCEDAEVEEIREPAEEANLLQRIDVESLIDVLQISTESWSSLTDDEDPEKLQRYYVDVALYNRRLELFKMGYFDIFEPPDERLFTDNLALSLESRLRIEASEEVIPDIDGEDNETGIEDFQHAGLQWIVQSVTSLLTSARQCLSM
jgi:hypothetical protein